MSQKFLPHQNENSNDNQQKSASSWVPVFASVVLATTTVGIGAFFWRNVPKYGWDGTIRYIWEGDAYTPEMRDLVDNLENAEIARSLQESRIHAMEEALDLARLNSVDGQTSQEIAKKWVECFATESGQRRSGDKNLERTLADVSDKLDKIAVKIDSVVIPSRTASSRNNNELVDRIKLRKKLLSKSIVLDMERCDVLIGSYQVLKDQS